VTLSCCCFDFACIASKRFLSFSLSLFLLSPLTWNNSASHERERGREREKEKERQRETERDTQRERERERESESEQQLVKNKEKETEEEAKVGGRQNSFATIENEEEEEEAGPSDMLCFATFIVVVVGGKGNTIVR
jgi:hypothetical protein